jgi:hypothetical protein
MTGTIQIKDPSQMSPDAQVALAMDLWLKAAADYRAMYEMGINTEEQRKYMEGKRNVLAKTYRHIRAYDLYLQTGTVPVEGLDVAEAAMMSWIRTERWRALDGK